MFSLVALAAGCASTRAYFEDRGRDLADTVTLAVETRSVGAAAQLGPLLAGLSWGEGYGFGLRSGSLGSYEFAEAICGLGGRKGFVGGDEREGKAYEMESWLPLLVPSLYLNGLGSQQTVTELWREYPLVSVDEGGWQTCFQCEVSLSLFAGLRAGVNPVEALDFLLGWTTVDLCGDDVMWMGAEQPPAPVSPAGPGSQTERLGSGPEE